MLAHLESCRLVTLTGPGGVGKTQLARAAAPATDLPVRTVLLASVRDPVEVLPAIAGAVGAHQGPAASTRDSVVAALSDEPTLLLVDNFEQVIEAAPVVADLVDSCPQLRVLVTSRAPLRLVVDQELPVPPLAVPDPARDLSLDEIERSPALRLFVARARAADPAFTLTLEGAQAAAEICTRLGGLPLAIELAAARVRLVPPVVLRDRLADRFRLLTAGPADAPARHRTLEATLAWSHDLLTPVEQAVFRRLAVFAGSFSLADAEIVLPDPPPGSPSADPPRGASATTAPSWGSGEIVDALGTLVDHNLVQSIEGGRRLQLAETVRVFAAARLDESGEGPAVADRHAAHVLAATEADAALLRGRDQRSALSKMAGRRADGDVALRHLLAVDPVSALRLAVALAGFWDSRSALTEARTWFERALAASPEPTLLRAVGLTWAGYFAALQLDLDAARSLGGEALAIADAAGSDLARGYALLVVGAAALEAGDVDEGTDALEESFATLRAAGDAWGAARPLNNLAEAARSAGDLELALARHEEALAASRALGDRHSQVMVLCGLGQVRRLHGDTAGAQAAAIEAVELGLPVDNGVGVATAFELLAAVASEVDDHERAAGLWGAADRLRRRTGSAVERRDRADQASARTACREALGAERFEAHCAAGAVLSTADAAERLLP